MDTSRGCVCNGWRDLAPSQCKGCHRIVFADARPRGGGRYVGHASAVDERRTPRAVSPRSPIQAGPTLLADAYFSRRRDHPLIPLVLFFPRATFPATKGSCASAPRPRPSQHTGTGPRGAARLGWDACGASDFFFQSLPPPSGPPQFPIPRRSAPRRRVSGRADVLSGCRPMLPPVARRAPIPRPTLSVTAARLVHGGPGGASDRRAWR